MKHSKKLFTVFCAFSIMKTTHSPERARRAVFPASPPDGFPFQHSGRKYAVFFENLPETVKRVPEGESA